MNKNMVVQLVLAFLGGACVALAPLASDGVALAEVFAALGAGATAALALFKQSPRVLK